MAVCVCLCICVCVLCWCRLEKTDKETHKQVYFQLLSRCCKELSLSQLKLLPPNMRNVIEPKFEAYQEKKRMYVPVPRDDFLLA